MKNIPFHYCLSLVFCLLNLYKIFGSPSSIRIDDYMSISDKKFTSVWPKSYITIDDLFASYNQSKCKNSVCYDSTNYIYINKNTELISSSTILLLKNDTVFCYEYSVFTDSIIDSLGLISYTMKIEINPIYYSIKIKGNKYLRIFEYGDFWIIRYRKKNKLSLSEQLIVNKIGGKVVGNSSIFRYNTLGDLEEDS